MQDGVQVKCIDSSRTWLKYSSVPKFFKVRHPTETRYFAYWKLPNLWNCIYDCSRLSTLQLREFVSGMLATDFQDAVQLDEQGIPFRGCIILEECQNLCPSGSLRSKDYQEISRCVSQGRNFSLSYIAITQRLSSVDANLVEILGLKFFGKIEGANNTRKARSWVSKELLEQSRDFPSGTFIKQYGSKATIEQVPLFTSPIRPVEYREPIPEKPKGFFQKLLGL